MRADAVLDHDVVRNLAADAGLSRDVYERLASEFSIVPAALVLRTVLEARQRLIDAALLPGDREQRARATYRLARNLLEHGVAPDPTLQGGDEAYPEEAGQEPPVRSAG